MNATVSVAEHTSAPSSTTPEITSLLLTLQASLSLVAGLSALPFAIVEPGMRVESVLTIGVATLMFVLARQVRQGRRWARRWVVGLETASLVTSLLLMVIPIGAMRGPVPAAVNLVLPAAVLWLLLTRPTPGSRL